MSAELMLPIYAKAAQQYPNRPYGGKRPASVAQKRAAKSNPWLAHLKATRAEIKKQGITMTPIELAKYARTTYEGAASKPASRAKGAGRAAPRKAVRKPRGGAIIGGRSIGGAVMRILTPEQKMALAQYYGIHGGGPIGGGPIGGRAAPKARRVTPRASKPMSRAQIQRALKGGSQYDALLSPSHLESAVMRYSRGA